MANESYSTGSPDAFVRPGQAPATPSLTDAQSHTAPLASAAIGDFAPPSAGATPYALPAPGRDSRPHEPHPFLGAPSAPAPQFSAAHALGGATAVGGRRRKRSTSRLLVGVGSLATVAVLVAASGQLGSANTTVARSQQPAAAGQQSGTSGTAPNGPGSGVGSGTGSARAGNSGTNTGTSASTNKSNATDAQSQGVVLIATTLTSGSAAGTGMVLDASGLVLTNYHVVQGSTDIEVTIASTGKVYTASVVGHDATNDVALLQLAGASGLATVSIDDDAVSTGDDVTAVGNANGQEYLTAAPGTVTDTSTTVTVSNDSASGSETLKNVYETDAAAEPGDSGGPLFDAENEVTGMTTAGQQTYRGPRGNSGTATTVASYAIPIAKALSIVDTIEAGQESSTVQIGANAYLGIMVSTQGSGSPVVSSVTAGTPAAKAGIKAGATITSIGGTPVRTQAEIAATLSERDPGDVVKVVWEDADGDTHSAQVTLAESPVN